MRVVKKLLLYSLILLGILFITPSIEARQGCCSWHGGVCGCGCCDGTGLSATCLPYYPGCSGGGSYYSAPVYVPPTPENPITDGRTNIQQSNNKPYFTVTVSWDSSLPVSIAISRVAGANPGPNTDTSGGSFQFTNITSGRWYVNMKAAVNGVWSTIRYWTIDVPMWIDPTPTPSPEPTSPPIPTVASTPVQQSDQSSGADILTGSVFGIGVGTIGLFVLSKIIKYLS